VSFGYCDTLLPDLEKDLTGVPWDKACTGMASDEGVGARMEGVSAEMAGAGAGMMGVRMAPVKMAGVGMADAETADMGMVGVEMAGVGMVDMVDREVHHMAVCKVCSILDSQHHADQLVPSLVVTPADTTEVAVVS
jgi:hypothetical protein